MHGTVYILHSVLRNCLVRRVWRTYPDPGLGEVGPHGDLLPGGHVRVPVPREQRLQLLGYVTG